MVKKILLFLIVLLSLSNIVSANEPEITLETFASLPVLEEGRIKPIETYAQNTLLRFSGRRSYDRQPATHWLAKLVFTPEETGDEKVFLINHPDIPTALGATAQKRRRYSFNQLKDGFEKLSELREAALKIEDDKRSLVESEIIRVYTNIESYLRLRGTFQFAIESPSFAIDNEETKEKLSLPKEKAQFAFLDIALQAGELEGVLKSHGRTDESDWGVYERTAMRLLSSLFQWGMFYQGMPFAIIPSIHAEEETWLSPWDAIALQFTNETTRQEMVFLRDAVSAYRDGRQLDFDLALRQFQASIWDRGGKKFERASKYLSSELFYNQLNAFRWAKFLYLIAFFFLIVFLLKTKKLFYTSANFLILFGLILHTFALVLRVFISGRPPVTSLYETFIFVGALSVLLGILIEVFQKKGLGLLVASISGFILLVIAGKYSTDGDTLKMLVAVLNSNFWLTIHVPTITAGYAACCVAGVLGHLYLIQAVIPHKKKKDKSSALQSTYRNTIGMLGLGLTLTFFGTCLGGIWADQSWGRFWGWDPKENGALMIVLWVAMILHARMGGMIRELGTAVMSALGILVVAWAWFGVNLLSVGLHSYGFTAGAAVSLGLFVLAEIVVICILAILASRKTLSI